MRLAVAERLKPRADSEEDSKPGIVKFLTALAQQFEIKKDEVASRRATWEHAVQTLVSLFPAVTSELLLSTPTRFMKEIEDWLEERIVEIRSALSELPSKS